MSSIEIKNLTKEYVEGALDVLRECFFTHEKVCTAVGILKDSPVVDVKSPYKCTKGSLELEALCLDVLKDDVSLVAVDTETNEVVGVAFNKLQVLPPPGEKSYFEKFYEKNIKDPSALALVEFMIDADSKVNLFEHYNASCALELMFLGVKTTSSGKGIGQRLVEETIKKAREIGTKDKPGFVCAIFSSRFSQKAGSRAGMETLYEFFYTDVTYKGKTYAEILGPDHPSSTICGIKI